MLYCFAALQQTSTFTRQKIDLFYLKFSPEINGFGLTFQKQEQVAKKWLKLKQSRTPHICGIRRVSVNNQFNKLELVSKGGTLVKY